MSCGDSLVQETPDSIDEVSRCQAPMAKSSKFFSSGRLEKETSRNPSSQHSLRPIRDADRKLNLSLWNIFRIPIVQNRFTCYSQVDGTLERVGVDTNTLMASLTRLGGKPRAVSIKTRASCCDSRDAGARNRLWVTPRSAGSSGS